MEEGNLQYRFLSVVVYRVMIKPLGDKTITLLKYRPFDQCLRPLIDNR